MDAKEREQKVIEMLKDICDKEEIDAESGLMEDLELSSIEIFALLSELEEVFDIVIPESRVNEIITVNDLLCVIARLTEETKAE